MGKTIRANMGVVKHRSSEPSRRKHKAYDERKLFDYMDNINLR